MPAPPGSPARGDVSPRAGLLLGRFSADAPGLAWVTSSSPELFARLPVMGTASTDGPDRVIRTLARLARVLERACVDLTLPQYRVLALVATGSERATHLAGELALTKPTVSAMVESLVERGLVERASVSGDRRAVRLTVTPAGRRALRAAEDAMRTRLETVITH